MSLDEKIFEVQNIFEEVDNKIKLLKNKYYLNCITGCGDCCMKENIEATVLEFLPAAQYLLQNCTESDLNFYYQKAENEKYCIFYNSSKLNGKCDLYQHRGLICRLFGFSGRINKNNNIEIVACKKLKNTCINKINDLPLIHDYYLRLSTIDPSLYLPFYPINKAIQKSIEIVSLYFHYKKTG